MVEKQHLGRVLVDDDEWQIPVVQRGRHPAGELKSLDRSGVNNSANRHGLRAPLAAMLVLLGGSTLVLLVAPGSVVAALGSAALFGVGFTTGFAFVAMWSQEVFRDRPTTGFTLTIVSVATGFIVGPTLFGLLATGFDRPVALLIVAMPAFLAALVPPARGSSAPAGVAVGGPTNGP